MRDMKEVPYEKQIPRIDNRQEAKQETQLKHLIWADGHANIAGYRGYISIVEIAQRLAKPVINVKHRTILPPSVEQIYRQTLERSAEMT